MSYPIEQYEQDELEKYLKLAPGDTRMTAVLASEVVALRSQLAQAKADTLDRCAWEAENVGVPIGVRIDNGRCLALATSWRREAQALRDGGRQ